MRLSTVPTEYVLSMSLQSSLFRARPLAQPWVRRQTRRLSWTSQSARRWAAAPRRYRFHPRGLDRRTLWPGRPTGFIAACVLAAAIFISTQSNARKEHGTGFLMPSRGVLRIAPPRLGNITAVAVRESQHVEQGAVLCC